MDIRFGPEGAGVGKVATVDEVIYDPVTRNLGVKDYAALPARLIDVKPEKF